MKIWFDADNGPHALIMKPLVHELTRRGHEVVFTARNRTNTPQLLDLYGFSYSLVGGPYKNGRIGKIVGTLLRAASLWKSMRKESANVSFGHGSRALPIASKFMRIPSVTMYDYEWVDATLFNWGCERILWPEAISERRMAETGVKLEKVKSYPGFKEELYLGDSAFDKTIAADLGLRPDCVHALLRPPATTAHYHNPEAEVIFSAILEKLATTENLQLVYLPRTEDQVDLPHNAGIENVIVPKKVYDGPSLVAAMDLVISGGGTMTREAAIMGVPSYSFFRGQSGMVDEALADSGKLVLITSALAVNQRLILEKQKETLVQPNPTILVNFIAEEIVAAGRG